MTQYKTGQCIKITFQNDYHNTSAVGIAKITKVSGEHWQAMISEETLKRLEKKLCGMADCKCGNFRGIHKVTATGQKVAITGYCLLETGIKMGVSTLDR